ncbi:Protein of unknown function [Parasphingorhabdus marina DSM 22363]|uniref:DUF2975 domain-containing protein n=1 Tax=Parasphingorhabdus marina DSM 22363 TaxID=1123272 RepID=A0A1N6CU93_9SPHN|nr:DUF2975 domain-containing protein [Parasphingorhabdus marina]SIN62121.1 Protein of unknown function [Parasphingorhabdus marina DSM 22363]
MNQTTKSPETNDIVLKSTRGLLIVTKWLMLLGVTVLTFAIPVLLFFSSEVAAEMADTFVTPPGTEVVWMIVGLMLLGIVMMLLTLFGLNRLRRIVDSVGEGNPFTRINGTRLRGMGVAAFAIQIVTFVGSLLASAMVSILGEVQPGEEFSMHIEGGLSISGILLVLLLIILARVFDRGAEMQDELQGTV